MTEINDEEILKKDLIDKIKEVYANHDDLEEMLEDLNDERFRKLAKKMCDKDNLNKPELGKELFLLAENRCKSSCDFSYLGEAIYSSLKDKNWVIILLEKSRELAENLFDYKDLIESIPNSLEYKELSKKIALDIFNKLKDEKDIFEFIGVGYNLKDLVEFILKEDSSKNLELKEIFNNIISSTDGITYLLDTAREVKEIYKDSDYTTQYIDEVLDKVIDIVYEGYYCDIYYFIKDDIKDDKRAQEFRDSYEDEMRNDYEEYGSCEEIYADIDLEEICFDDYEDKRNIISFNTGTFPFEEVEDMVDKENNFLEEAYEIANELLDEFISKLREKFENNFENTVYVNIDGKLKEYNSDINHIEFWADFELYIICTKDIPIEVVDALLLDMDEYCFTAAFQYGSGDAVYQNYDRGEYDTGYFSTDKDGHSSNDLSSNGYFTLYSEVRKLLED